MVADKKEYLRRDTDIYNRRRKGSQIVTDICKRRKRLVNIRNYLFAQSFYIFWRRNFMFAPKNSVSPILGSERRSIRHSAENKSFDKMRAPKLHINQLQLRYNWHLRVG